MDGQKRIWIQQVEYFYKSNDGIRFTWILNDNNNSIASMNKKLKYLKDNRMLSEYLKAPILKVTYDEFLEHDSDNMTLPEEHISKPDKIMIYAHERLDRAGYDINEITPQWVKTIYQSIYDTINNATCDVIVFGNNRGVTPDKLLSDVGSILGIPTSSELSNLFMDPTMNTTVIVAPSAYAATHESIIGLGTPLNDSDFCNTDGSVCSTDGSDASDGTKIVIIPPVVDTEKFSKEYVERNGGTIYYHDCNDCINIGFLARLSVEKNVGLFLMMASILVENYSHVRFTMIGDGPLKKELAILVQRLKISHIVSFTGWVDDKLPHILSGMLIVFLSL